jgi:hypothetical protein
MLIEKMTINNLRKVLLVSVSIISTWLILRP